MIHAALDQRIADEQVRYWLSHLVNAEVIWLDRIENGEVSIPYDRQLSLSEAAIEMESVHQRMDVYMQQLSESDLTKQIAYTNSRGDRFESAVQDILTHLINHSTHHRAQAAARIRMLGGAPPVTDFIHFVRQ